MLILNTGGTFNKIYNPISGNLDVPYNNSALEKIFSSYDAEYDLAGVVYKDSLDIDSDDRKMIANIIMASSDETFIIVHGTDTMHTTAEFLDEIFDDKTIILVGAMRPLEIDVIEGTLNLGIALGFAKANRERGVYISMSGHVKLWSDIEKNRALGKFEVVR